jgi:hypothetical protein
MSAELLDDLRERLTQIALPTYGHPAGFGTIALNNAIRKFASDRRLGAIQEYSVEAFRRPDGYNGRIDWVIKSKDRSVHWAIEIDRANKRWSLEKLLRAHLLGMTPIWIRWRAPISIEIPGYVTVIDLCKRKTAS